MIERLMDERKLDVLALSETKLKGREELFSWEKVRGVKVGASINQQAKERVAILMEKIDGWRERLFG